MGNGKGIDEPQASCLKAQFPNLQIHTSRKLDRGLLMIGPVFAVSARIFCSNGADDAEWTTVSLNPSRLSIGGRFDDARAAKWDIVQQDHCQCGTFAARNWCDGR